MKLNVFSGTNIEEELKRSRSITNELDLILDTIESKDIAEDSLNQFDIDQLQKDRVFHIENIKKTCIDYRLRFLDARYFKNKIPKAKHK